MGEPHKDADVESAKRKIIDALEGEECICGGEFCPEPEDLVDRLIEAVRKAERD